ncbi:MAG TPA: hypothetical protein ENJ80_12800 [Gammaproteobacteria bacterium]|nr:hypothetical protein [Gammaproteobacteria bacterium]
MGQPQAFYHWIALLPDLKTGPASNAIQRLYAAYQRMLICRKPTQPSHSSSMLEWLNRQQKQTFDFSQQAGIMGQDDTRIRNGYDANDAVKNRLFAQ